MLKQIGKQPPLKLKSALHLYQACDTNLSSSVCHRSLLRAETFQAAGNSFDVVNICIQVAGPSFEWMSAPPVAVGQTSI